MAVRLFTALAIEFEINLYTYYLGYLYHVS